MARRQDALAAIHREYVEDTIGDTAATAAQQETANKHTEVERTGDDNVDLSDEELLEKARNASNRTKFDRLCNGNIVGYDSQSEADMALCCLLAFWTGGDQTKMDQLFRQSGLCREKWDEVHYADGSTYGEKTVERAIAQTSEFYEPDGGDKSIQVSGTSDDGCGNAAQGDAERSRAYLSEKNQLLAERVDELEASLEQKNERIDALEAEVKQLEAKLAECDDSTDPTLRRQAVDTNKSDAKSETSSLWCRTKQLFDTDSE